MLIGNRFETPLAPRLHGLKAFFVPRPIILKPLSAPATDHEVPTGRAPIRHEIWLLVVIYDHLLSGIGFGRPVLKFGLGWKPAMRVTKGLHKAGHREEVRTDKRT